MGWQAGPERWVVVGGGETEGVSKLGAKGRRWTRQHAGRWRPVTRSAYRATGLTLGRSILDKVKQQKYIVTKLTEH
jgi:hypothetical protein